MNLIQTFNQSNLRTDLPDLRPGMTVKVHQRIKEGAKSRVQIFEGIIIAHKHGQGASATITVRKVTGGYGIERIFPIHLPTVEKFEVIRTSKVRRAKLYYLRGKTARETRRKVKVIETKTETSTSKTSTTEAEE